MNVKTLAPEQRDGLLAYLMRDPFSHLFHLADLDEPYAPFARWFLRREGERLHALALLYTWPETPVLQIIEPGNREAVNLLRDILPSLPPKVYCQISAGLPEALGHAYRFEYLFPFIKMKWAAGRFSPPPGEDEPVRLTRQHEPDIRSFDPPIWFEPRMLDHGCYYGIFLDGRLVSIAGTPVLSRQYGVAVIGGVGTAEGHRGRGFAARLVATLVEKLKGEFPYIGLNVRADNASAIRCYEKCGFERHGETFWDGVAVRK